MLKKGVHRISWKTNYEEKRWRMKKSTVLKVDREQISIQFLHMKTNIGNGTTMNPS